MPNSSNREDQRCAHVLLFFEQARTFSLLYEALHLRAYSFFLLWKHSSSSSPMMLVVSVIPFALPQTSDPLSATLTASRARAHNFAESKKPLAAHGFGECHGHGQKRERSMYFFADGAANETLNITNVGTSIISSLFCAMVCAIGRARLHKIQCLLSQRKIVVGVANISPSNKVPP